MEIQVQELSELLDKFHITRHKCKCCGNDIIYDNTNPYVHKGQLVIKGKSYRTIKSVDGIDYKLNVCQKCLKDKFPKLRIPVTSFCTMCESTKFAFDIPDDVYQRARRKYAMTKDHMIEKYGQEKGTEIWNNYCTRQAETNTFEYKSKKYGMSQEEFDSYNKSRAVTLDNLIRRHGQEKGTEIWNNYCTRQAETKSWEYMVQTYGESKAKAINKVKSNTLQAYINRYGQEKGLEIYMSKVESFRQYYSKSSQDFFNQLDKYLSKKYTTYYATKNKEYGVNLNTKYIFLDYYILELKICIEFNGTHFHGDPRIFKKDDTPNPFNLKLTAGQIWKEDKERYEKLKELRGIDTVIVWEEDYKEGIDIQYFIKNVLNIKDDDIFI